MFKLPHKYHPALIIFIISLISLDAVAVSLFGAKIPKSIDYTVLNSEFKKHSQLTSNQSNTLLALEAKIRGIPNKKIQKKLGVSMPDEIFPGSQKFTTNPLSVSEVALADTPAESNIAGFMEFSDAIGRSVRFWFNLETETAGENLAVKVLELELITPHNTEVEVFLVPEDIIKASTVYAAVDYTRLYEEISSIAVNKNSADLTGTHKYIAVAFYKNLIAPDMSINMKVADSQEGSSGLDSESRYQLIEDSWLVTVAPVSMDLARDKRWIKITTQAKSGVYNDELSKEHIIGLFPLNL